MTTLYDYQSPQHADFLETRRRGLIDFYTPHLLSESGGCYWLDNKGIPMGDRGFQLWLGARMLHCYCLEGLLGDIQAGDYAQRIALFYADGPGRDKEHGGWFAQVGGDKPDDSKQLYGQAHMLLAASSAVHLGVDGANELLDEALRVIDRYWDETYGLCPESYDRTFSDLDPYRGQNANMHLTEAYLAAFEATGSDLLLERAVRIAKGIASRAATMEEGSWRLHEHFTTEWLPDPEYNRDNPRHPFRPFGSQPGHWLEWAKLLSQIHAKGIKEKWLLPAAQRLFEGAWADGWGRDGGFCYTVDFDGRPVVEEKYWWEVTEAIGAALGLFHATGDESYLEYYQRAWQWCDHVLVEETGAWVPEVSAGNAPSTGTWQGRPDMYHAYQATLYAHLGPTQGLAQWAHASHPH
ncbi:MAG: AGE family epimerase/isomerase [Actinomycetaceae bacterium]|nr:AGE family epimerase/isomerase [Actinomycetaceae bacterium]